MSSLPQPVTAISVDDKPRRGGLVGMLRSRWSRFKQSRNSGSNPSMFDKDFPAGGGSTEASTSITGPADEGVRRREVYYALPIHKSSHGDDSFLKSRRKRTPRGVVKSNYTAENDPDELGDVNEVVVDNSFEIGGQQESLTEPSADHRITENQPAVVMQAGQGKIKGGAFGWDPKDKQNGMQMSSSHTHSQHDTNSMAHTGRTSMYLQTIKRTIRYTFSVVYAVFFPHFDDPEHERAFISQEWYLGKMLALIASGFLIFNWILACIFVPKPFVLFDYIFHFGIAPIITLPLPILIILRWPMRHPILYQIYVTVSVWSWSYWYILSIVLCGFYGQHSYFTCGVKDFTGTLYFLTGLPVLGLFALGQKRFPATFAATATIVVMGATIIPYRHAWGRILGNQICFHGFLIYVHWSREMADRDRFIMSRQIKEAYLYRHRLQMREKQIQNSKQRLTGYIFHEVRVPLNTAMLAVQNIEASGTVAKPLELEFNALTGSLTVMSKVLNDVLDLNRMDAGKFESVNKPYSFHKVIESLLVPLRLAASAKGLHLVEDLDPRIDEFVLQCLVAAKKAKGNYDESEELEPLVSGDEMRCRQIFTNFTSNATKFSPPGGRIEIVTKLLYPSPPGIGAVSPIGPGDPDWVGNSGSEKTSDTTAVGGGTPPVSTAQMPTPGSLSDSVKFGSTNRVPLFGSLIEKNKQRSVSNEKDRDYKDKEKGRESSEEPIEKPPTVLPVDQVVIRIEVRDTGMGIKKKDVKDAKLFSPYVQTEIGRHQGGKGTGLGLALVRRIVKLSGGRLGVKSKFGQGSCFWVELPLGVGNRVLHAQSTEGGSRDVSIRSRSMPPTRTRDFAIDQSSTLTNLNLASPDRSARASFSYAPPAPHVSHRTIMEQQGLVEMTPSRPELRHRQENALGTPLREVSPARPPTTLSAGAEALPQIQRSLEVPRQDSSASAPPALGQNTSVATVPVSISAVESAPATPSEPLSILVVDDDALTRKLMTRMLTRLGCTVTTAENGVKALEILLASMFTPSETASPSTMVPSTPGTTNSSPDALTNQPRFFDVVFLDNQMPQMSGLETIARLRAAGREDLVVGVTGNALIRDQDEYLTAGVDHVLIKPVLEKSLRQMLSLAERRRTADKGSDTP